MTGTRSAWTLAATAVALLFAVDAPLEAQRYRADIGINGGGVWFSNMIKEDDIGGAAAPEAVSFDPGWITGLQATLWATPRVGIRANGAYTERPVEGPEDSQLAEDINIWSFSGDVLFRLRELADRWEGRSFTPYIALGLGIQNINPALNVAANDGTGEELGHPISPVFPGIGDQFFLDEDIGLMGLLGLGGDLRMSPNFLLRLEVNDRIYDAPVHRYTGAATIEEETIGNLVHQVSGTLGLHAILGLQAPQQVVVAPPPPTPPAAPAPPPPPPTAEAVTICVIDPAAPGGIRMVSAFYRPTQRDTVVVEAGDTVAFRTRVPADVPLAPSATWYVEGRPLVFEFTTAPRRSEFLSVGTARMVPATDLAYLGRVDGVPVYAARTDISAVQTQWTAALDASADDDLRAILRGNNQLRTTFNNIQALYVPVQPIGCVFQALQRQEEVRKGGK